MKITKEYIPNLLLSILLVFAVIGAAVTAMTKYYIINEATFIDNSNENNIPQMAYEELEKYFNDSEDYSGIPASVYMSAITKDNIKEMINAKIKNVFSSFVKEDRERVNFDFTPLENSITDYFDKFAQENNVEVDDAYKNQLQKTIDTAKNEINDFSDIYMLTLIEKTDVFSKAVSVYKYLDIIMYICIGLAVLCMVVIAVISKRKLQFALYWYSTAILCSSVIMMIPTLYIKLSGITKRFAIGNKCIYYAITGYMSKVLNTMIIFELIMIAAALIIFILYLFISKTKKENN